MTTAPTDFRQQLHTHCMRMARVDRDYAHWAAGNYEAITEGALPGFARETREAIDAKYPPQPQRRTRHVPA
jgi:hypothetical protein